MGGIQTAEQVKINGKVFNINALTREQLDDYTAGRFEKIQRKMLTVLKTADYSKVPVNQLAVALGIVTDKARLIRGQSTSNTAVSGRIDAIHRVQVLSGRLEQALEGKDRSTSVMIPARAESIDSSNNGNSCQSLPNPAHDADVIEVQATDCEPLPVQRKASRYVPTGRPKGRPRKAQATPPPAPGGGPTSGSGDSEE